MKFAQQLLGGIGGAAIGIICYVFFVSVCDSKMMNYYDSTIQRVEHE
jgi:hypothetical protein